MANRPEVIIVHESVRASYLKDFGSVAAFAALVGVGILLDNQIMQWLGAIFWILLMGALAVKTISGDHMTIAAARERLDEIERGAA